MIINKKYKFVIIIISAIVSSVAFQVLSAESQNLQIDLIHKSNMWQPFGATFVSQNDTNLNVIVSTDYEDKLWNRIFLPMEIKSAKNMSLVFELDYKTTTYSGNASFFSEVRDATNDKILWNSFLNNTSGELYNQTFRLPNKVFDRPIEFRIYIATDGPGEHILEIDRAKLTIL